MQRAGLWITVFLVSALAAPARGGEDMHLFVNRRAFDVSVAPVDEQSKEAESSILYQRIPSAGVWESLGPCGKITLPNGDVRFTREVDVARDGIYHYTSRPVVGGTVERPPTEDSPPQAVVVVDTLAPTVEITSPEEDFETKPGEQVDLSWVVSDENLGDTPAALTYSGDGGKSWNVIHADLPAAGEYFWTVPNDLSGPALVRLAAIDKAGNVGRALRAFAAAKREPPPAPAASAPAPAPAEEPPAPAGTTADEEEIRDPYRSWLYYLMALNLMRQNKPADALQYYWLSVKADPGFINAWADIALAYNELGAHKTARDIVEQTRERAPDRIDLVHLLGETYHAEGMHLLGKARDAGERLEAKGSIDQAAAWYGRALDMAAKEWKLAEQAGSFYRLGEICYYVNMDKDGARAYWEKILSLHVPTPNADLLHWSMTENKSFERRRHERNTDQWVALHTWQNWARGYLEQMDERERRGMLDMMAAQKIRRAGSGAAPSLSYAGNAMNPGREDGRSLFSLPGQLGSPGDVAAGIGIAGAAGTGIGGANAINFPAHINRPPLTDGYSFYAGETSVEPEGRSVRRNREESGLFSGRPETRPPEIRDPYSFPLGGGTAAWNDAGPYGNQPIRNW